MNSLKVYNKYGNHRNNIEYYLSSTSRLFSSTTTNFDNHKCKVLIIGGGSAGCAMTSKFTSKFGKGKVIVLEPNDKHYYQPMFTLVGGGMKSLDKSVKTMQSVLPKSAKWLKDAAMTFKPKDNLVITANGDHIEYEVMIVAMGLQLQYDKIPGLIDGLSMPMSGVCSNYSPKYVERTYETLKNFKGGNAIFTFPASCCKCPGAPQKAVYISEHFFRKAGIRDKTNVIYNTALPVIFGVKHYADALWPIIKERNITVNLRTNLIEVIPRQNLAVFQNLDKPEEITTIEYSMLHVAPPQTTPDVLKNSPLVDANGFVDVSKDTLQHVKYNNIFAMGDNSNSPNSKTGASAAAQSPIVYKNVLSVLNNKKPTYIYDGYASCPLVTGYSSCILAEFDYSLTPLETFPISQNKERWTMFFLKKHIMPPLYWELMMKGYWNGPGLFRKIMNILRFGENRFTNKKTN